MATVVNLRSSELAEESAVQGPSGTRLSLSPYDVPRSLMIDIDPKTHELRMRFNYTDSELEFENRIDDVRAHLGRHSGKVLGLWTTIVNQTPGTIRMNIAQALHSWAARAHRDNERMNYVLVEHILELPPVQDAITKTLVQHQ
jgi:hypothetical protein